MEIINVEVYYKKIPKIVYDIKLKENNVGIAYVINYKKIAEKLKEELKKKNKKVFMEKGSLTVYKGQVLGCDVSSVEKIKDKIDCLIFVGNGKFHLKEIARIFNKKIYLLDPINETFKEVKVKKEKFNKKLLLKMSKKIGIVVSVKKGQFRIKEAIKLKEKLKDKEVYLFLANEINENSFLNFPKLDLIINTACPRIKEDFKNVINLSDAL